MTEQMPKDTVLCLRQVSSAITPGATYPQWFLDMNGQLSGEPWKTLLNTAADELETMQKLNGKLYRTLYPD